jgi:hypothetical protein
MSNLTQVKVVLAVVGLVLFGAGVRFESTVLRWTGLGFVVMAWLLRFMRPRNPGQSSGSPE